MIPPPHLSPMWWPASRTTPGRCGRLGRPGGLNVQFAVKYDPDGTDIYVIEANPRASRTVPFVAKATGVPLAKVASRVMMGATLADSVTGA
ncbi:MAG: hypothetical protein CM1200mP26_30150 [Acidimicrobiales bacterium]|nr:MAG: hypothetical protein CM1200mP26_30150 [Acidimicrobiales bacterium]